MECTFKWDKNIILKRESSLESAVLTAYHDGIVCSGYY